MSQGQSNSGTQSSYEVERRVQHAARHGFALWSCTLSPTQKVPGTSTPISRYFLRFGRHMRLFLRDPERSESEARRIM